MLSYPDKNRFEQLRAHWESADQGARDASAMGDKKGKHATNEPGSGESPHHASKFRRKLSNGLAFIANPLAQRKSVSGSRQPTSNPSLAVVAPKPHEAKLSPLQDSAPKHSSHARQQEISISQSTLPGVADKSRKPLPRSRTTSFIPRPARSVSGSSTEDTRPLIPPKSPSMNDPRAHVPSKIPSPTPSLSMRRVSSPRQYVGLQQSKETTQPIASRYNDSPSKGSVRSHTTPNLAELASSQTGRVLAPMRPGYGQHRAVPDQKSKENMNANNNASQNHTQGVITKRESLVVPTTVLSRRSWEPSALKTQDKLQIATTEPGASKRSTLQSGSQSWIADENTRPRDTTGASSIRYYANKAPLSPIHQKPPAAVQYKSLGTSNQTRVHMDAGLQVSKLPHSSTFHNFSRKLAAPSMAQQPATRSSASVSNLVQALAAQEKKPLANIKPVIPRYPVCDKSPKRQLTRHERNERPAVAIVEHPAAFAKESPSAIAEQLPVKAVKKPIRPLGWKPRDPDDSGDTMSLLSAAFAEFSDLSPKRLDSTDSLVEKRSSVPGQQISDIVDQETSDTADVSIISQVTNHMPTAWWAGRFQARFDKWRTAAMAAALDPDHDKLDNQAHDPLCGCGYRIDNEKMAAACIMKQLRDLCKTDDAAESLWKFEIKYRKTHNLPPPSIKYPPKRFLSLSSKRTPSTSSKGNLSQDEQPNDKGTFGKAVRKMTPRKSSLVNLLKGRGWNKEDEVKSKSKSMYDLWTTSEDATLTGGSKTRKKNL